MVLFGIHDQNDVESFGVQDQNYVVLFGEYDQKNVDILDFHALLDVVLCVVHDHKHVEPFGVHILKDVQLFCVHFDERGALDQCDVASCQCDSDVAFCDHCPEVLKFFGYPVFYGWSCPYVSVAFVFVFQELRHVRCLATPWKS